MPKIQNLKDKQNLRKKDFDKQMDFEAKQNLLGFFNLLLKIDTRNHPERYKNERDLNEPEKEKC